MKHFYSQERDRKHFWGQIIGGTQSPYRSRINQKVPLSRFRDIGPEYRQIQGLIKFRLSETTKNTLLSPSYFKKASKFQETYHSNLPLSQTREEEQVFLKNQALQEQLKAKGEMGSLCRTLEHPAPDQVKLEDLKLVMH